MGGSGRRSSQGPWRIRGAVLGAGCYRSPLRMDAQPICGTVHIVTVAIARQAAVHAFVEQDPHAAVATSRSVASSRKVMTCSRVTVGKLVEEVVDRVTGFQVVQQRLNWHTCAGEHRSSSHRVGRSRNEREWEQSYRASLAATGRVARDTRHTLPAVILPVLAFAKEQTLRPADHVPARWRPAPMGVGRSSERWVEPSMSVKRKVTVPVGREAVMGGSGVRCAS